METLKTAFNEIVLGNKERDTEVPVQPRWHETEKMKCIVYNGKYDMQYVDHPKPCITVPTDVILKVTATTVCGSDLHLYKGTFMGMRKGDIPGHEFMGIVEEVGDEVQKIKVGDRVVVSFAITCGKCDYCKREEYTSCSTNNPSKTVELSYGNQSMAAYGYSHLTGAAPGGQAEYVRVMLADQNCMKIPDELPDEKALYLTDIVPTGYHGAVCGEVREGRVVGIWGLGPIGLMCAQWCKKLGAKRVIGIDTVPERLACARDKIGIETIDFRECDVPDKLNEMLGGGQLDVAIECVGFDFPKSWLHKLQQKLGLETDTPEIFTEIFRAVRNSGNVGIIGDYYMYANHFPIGMMMEKGLVVKGGQCPAIKYWKYCLEMVQKGEIDPTLIVTDRGTLADAPSIYERMSKMEDGCIKSFLRPEHSRTTDQLEPKERAQELTPREQKIEKEPREGEKQEGKEEAFPPLPGLDEENIPPMVQQGMSNTSSSGAPSGETKTVVTTTETHEPTMAEKLFPKEERASAEKVFPSSAGGGAETLDRASEEKVFPTSQHDVGPEIYAATK